MNKKPSIAIITCNFNRLKMLKQNISSVKDQNYSNYKHYIIDDGSNDGSKEYLKNIHSDKIIFLDQKKNTGQPTLLFNSNIFKKINSEIIVMLDSDDYLLPNAFNIFLEYYDPYEESIWNYAFDFEDGKYNKDKLYYTEVNVKSKDLFSKIHPRNRDGKGFRDFINFRRKIFYDELCKYFTKPDFWYSAQYEVAANCFFNEKYIYKKIYFMSLGQDSVTRGFNLRKYKKHTLISRENIYQKYKSLMDKDFYQYTYKSLVMNYLVNKGYKKKIFYEFFYNFNFFRKNILFFLFILFLFPFPSNILLYIKHKIKYFKNKRY